MSVRIEEGEEHRPTYSNSNYRSGDGDTFTSVLNSVAGNFSGVFAELSTVAFALAFRYVPNVAATLRVDAPPARCIATRAAERAEAAVPPHFRMFKSV
jgi:hypothetical protein